MMKFTFLLSLLLMIGLTGCNDNFVWTLVDQNAPLTGVYTLRLMRGEIAAKEVDFSYSSVSVFVTDVPCNSSSDESHETGIIPQEGERVLRFTSNPVLSEATGEILAHEVNIPYASLSGTAPNGEPACVVVLPGLLEDTGGELVTTQPGLPGILFSSFPLIPDSGTGGGGSGDDETVQCDSEAINTAAQDYEYMKAGAAACGQPESHINNGGYIAEALIQCKKNEGCQIVGAFNCMEDGESIYSDTQLPQCTEHILYGGLH